MSNSQRFDGMRLSVKLPWLVLGHLDLAAGGNSREDMLREWLENWRTLAGLAPYLYQRLVYAAQRRRLPLAAIVNDALTKYCSELPDPPAHAKVSTPIDLLAAEGEPKSSKKRGE